ncbi:TPA: tRNA (N(6)-L-threonylcarbamoyladenosine(37)-C(2))-methylthiotransferase MtaB [bacterium]|nr:tRNA (N(6)-L-threonylcarbamoyladenosine(37)-C(2))-methylthiotransferase MtaB [bacterium]
MRSVSFKTFGCRLNQYDTEWLREEFEHAGFKAVSIKDNPDICVINTCAVTDRACHEARKGIRTEVNRLPKPFVIVTGCYARIGINEISQIKGVNIVEPDPNKIAVDFLKTPLLPGIKSFGGRSKAFVKIQEGCDQFCSYCVVPYVRGKPRDRSIEEVIREVNDLVNNGCEEIVLTGTNIGKCQNLLDIVKEIDKVEGVRRIGVGSIEPICILDELLDFIQGSQKFSRYFHIPLQSGDNRILNLMKRWYTSEEYAELLYAIKERMPDCAIGADVIVGFPGEAEYEFLNTYNLIANSPISRLHIFRYSKRPGTHAINLPDEPPDMVKKERSMILHKLSENKWANFRREFIGKTLECSVEPTKDDGWLIGVTKNYIKVLFKPPASLPGNFINLKIKKVEGPMTYGEVS